MHKELFEEFRRFEGQPVRIFTDDSRTIQGIVFCAGENCCRVLKENGDVCLVDFCHIDAVEEPMMRLHRRCHDAIEVRQRFGRECCKCSIGGFEDDFRECDECDDFDDCEEGEECRRGRRRERREDRKDEGCGCHHC